MNTPDLKWIKTFIKIQVLLALGISCGLFFWKGQLVGISGLIGGIIGIVPGLFFIRFLFIKPKNLKSNNSLNIGNENNVDTPLTENTTSHDPKHFLTFFYVGEVLKLFIFLILLSLAFQWSKLKPAPLFFVFVITQMVYWLIPWIVHFNKKNRLGEPRE